MGFIDSIPTGGDSCGRGSGADLGRLHAARTGAPAAIEEELILLHNHPDLTDWTESDCLHVLRQSVG